MNGEADLIEVIGRLERRLLDPEVRSSPALLNELLAEDFFEIGASGRVFDKAKIIGSLRVDPLSLATVDGLEVRELAPGVALATYRLRSRAAEVEADRFSLRSSLWILRGDRWQLRFHQGTPAHVSP